MSYSGGGEAGVVEVEKWCPPILPDLPSSSSLDSLRASCRPILDAHLAIGHVAHRSAVWLRSGEAYALRDALDDEGTRIIAALALVLAALPLVELGGLACV